MTASHQDSVQGIMTEAEFQMCPWYLHHTHYIHHRLGPCLLCSIHKLWTVSKRLVWRETDGHNLPALNEDRPPHTLSNVYNSPLFNSHYSSHHDRLHYEQLGRQSSVWLFWLSESFAICMSLPFGCRKCIIFSDDINANRIMLSPYFGGNMSWQILTLFKEMLRYCNKKHSPKAINNFSRHKLNYNFLSQQQERAPDSFLIS